MELVIFLFLIPVVMLPMIITAYFLKDLGVAMFERQMFRSTGSPGLSSKSWEIFHHTDGNLVLARAGGDCK